MKLRGKLDLRPIFEWYFEEAEFIYDERERADMIKKRQEKE